MELGDAEQRTLNVGTVSIGILVIGSDVSGRGGRSDTGGSGGRLLVVIFLGSTIVLLIARGNEGRGVSCAGRREMLHLEELTGGREFNACPCAGGSQAAFVRN